MVFKGRFFSSKKSDTSSPDGSSNNSPRSFGSNSPSGSEKRKAKSNSKESLIANPTSSSSGSGNGFGAATSHQSQVKGATKKKDPKGKESQTQTEARLTSSKAKNSGVEVGLAMLPSSGSKSKKAAVAVAVEGRDSPLSSSVSPILASSLGLNRIKTKSGPLPQESFFSFRSDKGSTLGASNLSRPSGEGGSGMGSGGKKKQILNQSRVVFQGSFVTKTWVDNGSNSDGMSTGTAPSRDQSPNVLARSRLQNGESSSEAGMQFD